MKGRDRIILKNNNHSFIYILNFNFIAISSIISTVLPTFIWIIIIGIFFYTFLSFKLKKISYNISNII